MHGPEPADTETARIGKRRRRRHRNRRRKQPAGALPFENAGGEMLSANEAEAAAPSPWHGREERPFLRAKVDDDGEIRYRLNTRQRIGAKYLLREVFD